jgi:hypothetical protein
MLTETGQPNFVNVTVAAGVLRKDNPKDVARGGVVGTSAGVGWGDYNNDGYLDIYWRSAGTDPDNILFKNSGDGTFTDVTEESGVSLIGKMCDPDSQGSPNWVDYDNDGDLDLYVGNESSANILFQNREGGTFVDVTTVRGAHGDAFINPGNANGACWGDIDNDGDLDCYIANADQANRLIRNDLIEKGEPGFTDITFESGTGNFGGAKGCTVGDYDNDGDLDIYVNNAGPSNVLIQDVNPYIDRFAQFYVAVEPAKNVLYSNNGDGTFTDVTIGSGAEGMGEGRGVASGDVNDDGFLDLFVTNVASASGEEEQEGALLLNTGNSNNWIKIALVGTVSNRSAIGARVKVVSGDLTQMCEVASATGYNSADDPRANFGLGSRTEVDRIEVTWPAGATQTFTDPETTKINTVHTITEPTPRS